MVMCKAQAGRARVEPGLRSSLAFVSAVQLFTAESQGSQNAKTVKKGTDLLR